MSYCIATLLVWSWYSDARLKIGQPQGEVARRGSANRGITVRPMPVKESRWRSADGCFSGELETASAEPVRA